MWLHEYMQHDEPSIRATGKTVDVTDNPTTDYRNALDALMKSPKPPPRTYVKDPDRPQQPWEKGRKNKKKRFGKQGATVAGAYSRQSSRQKWGR